MEHLVCVQNERDRRTLGVTAPRFSTLRRLRPSAAAEQSLATIRQILASRNAPAREGARHW